MPILGGFIGFEMGEMTAETRPGIELLLEFGDFDMRQQAIGPPHQGFGFGGNHILQQRDFESFLRDHSIG